MPGRTLVTSWGARPGVIASRLSSSRTRVRSRAAPIWARSEGWVADRRRERKLGRSDRLRQLGPPLPRTIELTVAERAVHSLDDEALALADRAIAGPLQAT